MFRCHHKSSFTTSVSHRTIKKTQQNPLRKRIHGYRRVLDLLDTNSLATHLQIINSTSIGQPIQSWKRNNKQIDSDKKKLKNLQDQKPTSKSDPDHALINLFYSFSVELEERWALEKERNHTTITNLTQAKNITIKVESEIQHSYVESVKKVHWETSRTSCLSDRFIIAWSGFGLLLQMFETCTFLSFLSFLSWFVTCFPWMHWGKTDVLPQSTLNKLLLMGRYVEPGRCTGMLDPEEFRGSVLVVRFVWSCRVFDVKWVLWCSAYGEGTDLGFLGSTAQFNVLLIGKETLTYKNNQFFSHQVSCKGIAEKHTALEKHTAV